MQGITYDILQTQYVEGISYLYVVFKGKSTNFDVNKDYGDEYLGNPLWNGSIFCLLDTSEAYVWSLVDRKWLKVGA